MPAVMVSAELDHHDNDDLATGIKNLLKAKKSLATVTSSPTSTSASIWIRPTPWRWS